MQSSTNHIAQDAEHLPQPNPAYPVADEGSILAVTSRTASGGRAAARASDADRHVGNRIRERRVMLGLSQQQLAQMIGVTYQQAHKYERGLNRISAGRLYQISHVLNVPISWFFDGFSTESKTADLTTRQRMCLELARNFAAIDNEKHQEALSQMARALAAQSVANKMVQDGYATALEESREEVA
ncbi:helix-turn-helix domain-containing protein [Granulibacter bethesdensis]|nr:Transcriptional regulator [Granulibacter bethesdensis CGDNIH4]APH60337.1 Transcriptional regulator [Granulibacter bethesdensis]